MNNLKNIADNIELRDGIWFAKTQEAVSYPEDGSDLCLVVEDGSYWFQHRNKCIPQLVKRFSPHKTFFDIGGGNGYVSLGLQNAGIETVLIEPSIQGVRNAKARGLNNLVCSTLQDASFRFNSISAIGVFDVVEHIEDDNQFLKQMYDYLEPEGKLYITVPAYNFLWANEDHYSGHYRRYTVSKLKKQLRSLGYEINYSSYLFAALVLPVFLFRSLPSRFGLHKDVENIEKYKSEHGNHEGFLTKIIKKTLNREYKKIANGRRVYFGTSCLVVASKKKSR
ncbi:MAG: class I SAM-dependent methyltransferase [Bacteroidota bacterium]